MSVLPVEETLQDLVKVQSPKPEKNMTSKYSMHGVRIHTKYKNKRTVLVAHDVIYF